MILLTYYIHASIGVHFGPLRKILVDNRFHRIHHSTEQRHFDKNFGICFSIWDRMFGTACDPVGDEWPKVGLANVDPPRTIADYFLMPFRLTQSERRHLSVLSAEAPKPATIGSKQYSLAS